MRRVLVVVAVLVLGGWTSCQPVTGGEPMAGPTTAGYAALAAGEDWRYVGETDQPAFENSWANQGGSRPALAFRIREAGVVDIQGSITGGSNFTVVFTLPEGYRPSDVSYMNAIADTGPSWVPVMVRITSGGSVYLEFPGSVTIVYLYLQVFLAAPVIVT